MSSIFLRGLVVGFLATACGCAHSGADSPAKPEAAPVADATSPPADADSPGPVSAPSAESAPPVDSLPASDQPANPCEQQCQRRRMAEAIAWEMIVHGCRTTCANNTEQPPAAP